MGKGNSKLGYNNWITAGLVILATITAVTVFMNMYLISASEKSIVSGEEAAEMGADCIMVLGAKVTGDEPSKTLRYRLEEGVALYKMGVAPKLLLTGDDGKNRFDEVSVMKNFALQAGVPEEDIIVDGKGYNTYTSMYRAANVYNMKKMVVITQRYHLYRALYIANAFGMEANGVEANTMQKGQIWRDIREVLARNKDFLTSFMKPGPVTMKTE